MDEPSKHVSRANDLPIVQRPCRSCDHCKILQSNISVCLLTCTSSGPVDAGGCCLLRYRACSTECTPLAVHGGLQTRGVRIYIRRYKSAAGGRLKARRLAVSASSKLALLEGDSKYSNMCLRSNSAFRAVKKLLNDHGHHTGLQLNERCVPAETVVANVSSRNASRVLFRIREHA